VKLEINRLKSVQFQHPSAIPLSGGVLPAAWRLYRDKLRDIVQHHPAVSIGVPKNYDEISGRYAQGEHVDEWGCVWVTHEYGIHGLVKRFPLPTRESVRTLKMPSEDGGLPHGFMYLRLADLRGFEEIMIDFAEEPPELQMLLDVVLAYNLRQADKMLKEIPEPRMVYFGDDLGMQTSLPMSPAKWRKYLKPCFAQIFAKFRAAGHLVYMHTDGHINEIIPDLVECGVNVVNPQIRANGLENLVAVCKGKVCVDLDLDRQMMPFCTPQDLDRHVRECVEKLGSPEGGLWLKAEIGPDVPLENIEALLQAMETYRTFHSLQAAAV
jgi:uroporphyrinogen decarboxylase